MESSPPQLQVGQVFGAYRLDRFLGEGGMAQVFRAVREEDGETVALKIMKTDMLEDDVYKHRFVHEARSASEVRHENLVPILEAGEEAGHPYLAAGYVRGRTLEERIEAEGPLPLRDTIRIATDVAAGLDALHQAGVVHRDIKSSNILIDEEGTALLTDFGLARGRAYTRLTQPGQVVGTLDYLAPELIRGQPATPATDVYALGCTVFECVAGRTPFGHLTVFQVGMAHLGDTPPDPGTDRDDWSPDLSFALLQALEKEPERRPPTATAYTTMLQVAAAGARGSR